MDLACTQQLTCPGQDTEPPQARPALLGIGMAHVEGALHGSNRYPSVGRLVADPTGNLRWNVLGHVGQASAVQAHLHAVKSAGLDCIQPGLQLSAAKRTQQNADLDQRGLPRASPSFLLIFRQILNPFGVKALCKAKCYPNS